MVSGSLRLSRVIHLPYKPSTLLPITSSNNSLSCLPHPKDHSSSFLSYHTYCPHTSSNRTRLPASPFAL